MLSSACSVSCLVDVAGCTCRVALAHSCYGPSFFLNAAYSPCSLSHTVAEPGSLTASAHRDTANKSMECTKLRQRLLAVLPKHALWASQPRARGCLVGCPTRLRHSSQEWQIERTCLHSTEIPNCRNVSSSLLQKARGDVSCWRCREL